MTDDSFHLRETSLFPGKQGRRSSEFHGANSKEKGEKPLPAEPRASRRAGSRSQGTPGAAAAAEPLAATVPQAASSSAPSAVPLAPALGSRTLTGLQQSRARTGGGGASAAPPLGAGLGGSSKKLPQQAKSRRRDLCGKRQTATARAQGFGHRPD